MHGIHSFLCVLLTLTPFLSKSEWAKDREYTIHELAQKYFMYGLGPTSELEDGARNIGFGVSFFH